MNLKEILANRKGIKKVEVVTGTEEAEINYKVTTFYEEPDEDIYLAIYTPFIKNPYEFNWFIFIDYKTFLLGDNLYVLNTFPKLNIDRLFSLYLDSKLKPESLHEHTLLCYFLNHIHLMIPNKYQTRIEKIIKEFSN